MGLITVNDVADQVSGKNLGSITRRSHDVECLHTLSIFIVRINNMR